MINGKDFIYDKSKDINTEEGIRTSELVLPKSNMETIDIIPVLEGAMDDIFAIVIGVVLIAVGVFTFGAGTLETARIGRTDGIMTRAAIVRISATRPACGGRTSTI